MEHDKPYIDYPLFSIGPITMVMALLLQLVAIIIYPFSFDIEYVPVGAFVIVLSVASILTPLVLLFNIKGSFFLAKISFWVRAAFVFAVSVPLSGDRWPAFLLVLSLMLDAFILHKKIPGTIVCVVLILIDLMIQVERTVWDTVISKAPWHVLNAKATAYLIFISIIVLMSTWNRRLLKEKKENSRLKQSIERLTIAGEDLLYYAQSAKQRSAMDERNRLTREIHDVAGYTLTNIRMMMEAGIRNKDMTREELEQLLQWTLRQSQDGQKDIRSILRMIRSRNDNDRGIRMLLRAARVFQIATETDVRLEIGNLSDRWISNDRDLLALRILQEGMINAFRHGMAKHVEVSFFEGKLGVNMVVRDDGKGASNIEMGIGLNGMKERLQEVGGSLTIDSDFPGFRIAAFIPLETIGK
jgi:signal transduction histidine kinase